MNELFKLKGKGNATCKMSVCYFIVEDWDSVHVTIGFFFALMHTGVSCNGVTRVHMYSEALR